MTVQQLIEALEKVNNKSAEVITEGCDCDGDVGGIEENKSDVYLWRAK